MGRGITERKKYIKEAAHLPICYSSPPHLLSATDIATSPNLLYSIHNATAATSNCVSVPFLSSPRNQVNSTKTYTAIMHISYATLVLVPATWAAAIQVSHTESGIAETTTVLTSPSIIGPNPSDVGVRSLMEDLDSLNSTIQNENTNIPRDVSIITRRDVVGDLNSILDELKDIKEELTKTHGEANEKLREHIKEIAKQLIESYQKFVRKIVEILSGKDDDYAPVSRDVAETAEEIDKQIGGLRKRLDEILLKIVEVVAKELL